MGLFRFDWRRASLAFYLQIRIFPLVLIRKRTFSDERDQLSAHSHQRNTCKYNLLN